MRVLSDEDLQTISGGLYYEQEPIGDGGGSVGDYVNMTTTGDGYEITATAAISDQTLVDYQNVANTMDSAAATNFVAAAAQDFGIPVGPFTITPIFNPFSGPNDIRYGARAKVRC